MRVLLDTNIFFSVICSPSSIIADAYKDLVSSGHELFVSDYTIVELQRIISKKKPEMLGELGLFLIYGMQHVEVITVSTENDFKEQVKIIRDIDDRPILAAALKNKIDVILSGDKDFLEANIDYPKIMTLVEFVKKKCSGSV